MGALSIALLTTSASGALAADHTGSAAKKKSTPVTVVVSDTQGVNGPMTMTVTPPSVPAGSVKFTVQNQGTIIHETVVLKTNTPFDQMPVTKNKVSESKSVGESGDVGKGKTKSFTLKLKKGNYVLVCNIAKHYQMGMRAAFAVT